MTKRVLALSLLPLMMLACSSDDDGNGGGSTGGSGNAAGQAGSGGVGGGAGQAGTGAAGGEAGTGGSAGAGGEAGTGGGAGQAGSGGAAGEAGSGGAAGQAGASGASGAAGAGGSSGIPIDQLTASVASSICNALFRCCNAQDVEDYFFSYANNQELQDLGYDDQLPPNAALADEAACTALVAEMLDIVPFGDWMAQANAGKVTYHPDAARTCADTLDAATCGVEVSSALFDSTCFGFNAPVGPTQRSIFTRTMGPGDDGCVPLRDGTGARFFGTCNPLEAFCCYEKAGVTGCAFPFDGDGNPRTGTCQAVSLENEACSGGLDNVQLCQTGLDCDFDENVCVAPGTTPLQVGEDCIDSSFNLLGECQDSWCDMTGSSKCEPYKADGESCVFPQECENGACEGGVCGSPSYCTSAT